ncbi:MAG: Rieske 2Fe-2S domain-containing protein [Bacteroidota bacterium]
MGLSYTSVQWNKQKKAYDLYLWIGIGLMLVSFTIFQLVLHPTITVETLVIRATAVTAFVLLHLILSIGPLSRLNPIFLPLLYNRRHMGVSMFLIALVHGAFSIIQFHALGDANPIISVFTSNQHYESISLFPFQILGFFALVILFLMAATSHDFWLNQLSPRVWKVLHMGVYIAYALLVGHVVLGVLQFEHHLMYWVLVCAGFFWIASLHILAGVKEWRRLSGKDVVSADSGFHCVASVAEIPAGRGKSIFLKDQNIAIFNNDGQFSAVHNVCKHQMGPLGEGKIVDGCITCPWHGYQYLPENGQAPPPFTEKLHTYHTKIIDGKVWVNPTPNPEGTEVEPSKISTP